MTRRWLAWMFALSAPALLAQTSSDRARWATEAKATTIVRDDWGIAHIHGKTDADAVFGTIYAQCEDDFTRVENNYLISLGRTAEADGDVKLWQDLRQRLFLDPTDLRAQYAASPAWLRALMDAWADGLNFFLSTHPDVKPHVLTHWEPWMALSFTEASIGGDIERVDLDKLRAFYDKGPAPKPEHAQLETPRTLLLEKEEQGSNGIAIAPSNTANHHALLLINPHTYFYMRSEQQITSDEGLNAYGASTWGQFFVYQGFNDRLGWMHTSSAVDAVDEFADTVEKDAATGTLRYRYGNTTRPIQQKSITLRVRTATGLQPRTFTAYFDHRGPIVREQDGKWYSIELMNTPVKALEQDVLRTKARSYAEYRKTMELFGNSSNNTVFADADGDIAYWHGNFIPRRDTHFDFTQPVDGSNPATDWQGLHSVDEIPHLLNPESGWLENVNNWPWSGAGDSSLKQSDFPAYVDQGVESARGLHAIRVLQGRRDFTLETLMAAAYDPYLPWFARTAPLLIGAWDALPPNDPRKAALREPIALLRAWDFRWGNDSAATSIAVYWGEAVAMPVALEARRLRIPLEEYLIAHTTSSQMIDGLAKACAKLTADFGRCDVPWGEINRFQRLNDNIAPSFDDAGPSVAVPFVSSAWGSLAAFNAKVYPNTRKRYGIYGNTFVAVVEFGLRVRAFAVTAGGESGHPGSPHFRDEAERYATGHLREVYFYPDQLKGHTERTYHPGS